MAAETGFLIDGTVYEVPTLDSLTMGERRVMFDLSGATQEDFVRAEDETDEEHEARVGKMMRHPGFMEALMHVAYQRGNPGVKATKVSLVIDQTNFLDAVATMGTDEEPEEDAVPLGLTKPPVELLPSEPSSKKDSIASPKNATSDSSGRGSTNGSDEPPATDQPSTGTTRSATSSPALPPKESVG